MVKDRVNQYYTELLTYMQTATDEYPAYDMRGGMKYTNTPAHFPWMYLHQIDGSGTAYTLSNGEDAINLGFQLDIYEKVSFGACRNMANKARKWFVDNGFRVTYFNPIDNVNDRSINRFSMRVTKFET
jgi:hypothetical protein